MSDLIGRIALVTGASTGIGRVIATTLSSHGATIAACSRSLPGLEALQNEIEAKHGKIIISSVDVRDENAVQRFVSHIQTTVGPIDLLIANAGLGIFKPVIEMTTEEFDEQIATNLRGVFLSTKAVLPSMLDRKFGDIVIVSSLAGKNSFATGAAYCASKFGVRGYAHSLMLEVRTSNVRVITICPGSVDTPFFDGTHLTPSREKILAANDVADVLVSALLAPRRAMVSEIDIRPSNP